MPTINALSMFTLAVILLLPTAHPAPQTAPPSLPGTSVRFKHITMEEGLANSRVLSILQDRRGFMWFGTGEGLDRYDGYDFTLYQADANDPRTLSSNVIWALYEDQAGYLWVGTDGGGLNRFDPTTETFTRYLPDLADAKSISDSTVISIYEDREGVLWVGTLRGGLNRFDRESQTFTHYQNDPNDTQSLGGNEVSDIVEDAAGTLWIGTFGGGLNQLVPGKSASDPPTFRRYQHDPANPQSLSHDQVKTLYTDPLGVLWVGTWGGGLNRFDTATETFAHYGYDADNPDSLSSDTIAAIEGGPGGELWVGTWDGGLNRFDPASHTYVRYQHDPADPLSLSRDLIRSLYISRDGLLFAGTAGGGLNLLDLERLSFQTLRNQPANPNSLSQSDVRSILQDREGVLWIGTQSAGLNRYDPSTGLFTHYRHDPDDPASLSNDTVLALSEDPDGRLWVGTQEGLNRLDRKTGRFVRYQHDPANPHSLTNNTIWALYQDRSGTLWVGTYGGLNRFDRQTESFTRYLSDPNDPTSLSNNTVASLYEDGAGTLWVGTQGGLNRLDRRTRTFTRYVRDPNDPTSIINDSISVIYGGPNGALWLGTFEGLDQFDPRSGRALHYTMDDGLASNVVWGILPDEQGNLWLSTNNGLNRLDLRTRAIRIYDTNDGLVSSVFNGFAYAKSSGGELFFGGPDGLLVFDPAQITENRHISPLVFTDFQLANRPVPIGEGSVLQRSINRTQAITLSHLERVISISFAALDFRAPERIRYRYVLRGFGTQWNVVDFKRRFVTYTNLEPGTYVFQVQSTDQNGNWVLPGRAIQLTIAPPWWQTFWFRLALAGLLVLFIGAGYRFRIMMLQQRNRELERQVSAKTATLQLLNTELEQSIIELSTLNQIAQTLNRVTSLEAILEQVTVIMTRLFHAVGVAICLQSEDGAELDVIDFHRTATPGSSGAATDLSAFQTAIARLSIPEDFTCQDLFCNGKSEIFTAAQASPWLLSLWPDFQRYEFMHLMLVPVYLRGEIVGAIAIVRGLSRPGFAPNDVTLVETVANQMAGAIENRRLFSQEHLQREVAERRSRELVTLLNISSEVSSMLKLEPLLNLILDRVAQVIDFSSLLIFGSEGEELYMLAHRGRALSDLTEEDEFPIEWLQAETQLFKQRSPLVIADLALDHPVQEGLRKTFGPKAVHLLEEAHSCMIVPMVARDQVVGLLWFGHSEPDCYSGSQAEYLTAIAHQAAIAIENAHSHQDVQTAAADRERNRLAQELHDSVSQTLLAANMLAKALADQWEQSPESGRETLRQLHRLIGNALAEMRSLMLELRPTILAQKPLGEILRQLCDTFASRSQIPAHLKVTGDAILPAISQVTFYRIAQGALNNILQHAQASQVAIELTCTPKSVELRVADDGLGFDLAAVSPDRMGLSIMRERAENVGASLQIDSKPGQGTQITVRYDYPIG